MGERRFDPRPPGPDTSAVGVHVHIADMAAAGLVGAYVVSLRDRLVRSATRRRDNAAPLRLEAVTAAGRWAINRVYRDVLPANLTPISETISGSGWSVVFQHDGERFTASSEDPGKQRDAGRKSFPASDWRPRLLLDSGRNSRDSTRVGRSEVRAGDYTQHGRVRGEPGRGVGAPPRRAARRRRAHPPSTTLPRQA